ncbi:hypothetical protein BH10BAC3_BH10BAC3_16840 [soil metagenome]
MYSKIILISLFAVSNFCCGISSSSQDKNETLIDSSSHIAVSPDTTGGIVYFSFDNAVSWQNKSNGLPPGINLTDIAASGDDLIAATKQHGLFMFNNTRNSWSNVMSPKQVKNIIDAVIVFKDNIFIGTEGGGVFASMNQGNNWLEYNKGLSNLTIRRMVIIDDSLFIGTNDGLYVFNEKKKEWVSKFNGGFLQVNGITQLSNDLFIGTNKGVYKSTRPYNSWVRVLPDKSVHNIAVGNGNVYALAYNELFTSPDKGITWRSIQQGLPKNLYSFHLIQKDGKLFIGQWDGVYEGNGKGNWKSFSKGLPGKFPATELVNYNQIIVAASSGWVSTNK